MTKTGYVDFPGSNYGGTQTMRVYWKETVTEAPGATSTVEITKVQLSSNSYVGDTYYADFKIEINGTTAVSVANTDNWTAYLANFNVFYDVTKSGNQLTGTPVSGIAHNADGSKSVNITLKPNALSYAGFWRTGAHFSFTTSSVSKSITLSTIPVGTLSTTVAAGSTVTVTRGGTQILAGTNLYYGDVLTISAAAQTGYRLDSLKVNGSTFTSGSTHTVTGNLSVVTTASQSVCTMSTNATGTFGTAQTINVTTYITGATHTIVAKVGSKSQTVASNSTAASHSWTPSNTLMNGSPNSMSATCTLTCTTKSNGTTVGTSTVTVTLSMVAATVKPAPTITDSDANGYASTYGGYVSGKSLLSVTISDGLKYGASTVSRSSSANGITSGATSFSAGLVGSNSSITTSITDSRGQTGTASKSITILSYTPPSITTFSVHRTDSGGTPDDMGNYFTVTYDVAVTSLNNNNSKTLTLKYKKVSTSTWTTQAITLNTYSQSGTTSAISASGDYSWDVQLVLEDDFEIVTKSTKLSTAAVVESRRPKGKGVAFSKVAEIDGAFDIGDWDAVGRVLGLGQARSGIASGADLNDFYVPGVYRINSNTIAAGLSNCPSVYAGTLRVWISNGNAKNYGDADYYLLQEYNDSYGDSWRRRGYALNAGDSITWDATWTGFGTKSALGLGSLSFSFTSISSGASSSLTLPNSRHGFIVITGAANAGREIIIDRKSVV